VSCGLHRIERLMRLQALKARPRRRRLPPDLGKRQAAAVAPNVHFEAAKLSKLSSAFGRLDGSPVEKIRCKECPRRGASVSRHNQTDTTHTRLLLTRGSRRAAFAPAATSMISNRRWRTACWHLLCISKALKQSTRISKSWTCCTRRDAR
jgi:hypothetical protein